MGVSDVARHVPTLNDKKGGFMGLKVVTLEELKAQMREDFDGEDELIRLYGEAAEDAVIGATRRTFKELCRIGYYEQNGE